MNNILISNPFLFRPVTPPNSREEDTDFDFKYQTLDFERTWELVKETLQEQATTISFSESEESSVDASTISSPTISSTTDLSDDISMESNWLNQGGFDFDNYAATLSPGDDNGFVNDFVSNSNLLDDARNYFLGDQDFDQDFSAVFEDEKKKGSVLLNDQIMSAPLNKMQVDDAPFNQAQFDALPDIADAEINLATILTSSPAPAAENTVTSYSRGAHQRKAALGQRLVAPSPRSTEPEDIKPDVVALGINNGRVTRKRSISSVSKPSSSKSIKSMDANKKQRKYEIEDVNDPSVRNAKAAKMNRDRKKMEFLEMKERAENAEYSNETLTVENETLKARVTELETLYNKEMTKNRTATGVHSQMTNMKNVFEAIIPAMQQKFGRPMAVEVPDSFASIPAAMDENGQLLPVDINAESNALNPENFNILDESYQMQGPAQTGTAVDAESTYFTFHISPQAGKIRLDYDPSFH